MTAVSGYDLANYPAHNSRKAPPVISLGLKSAAILSAVSIIVSVSTTSASAVETRDSGPALDQVVSAALEAVDLPQSTLNGFESIGGELSQIVGDATIDGDTVELADLGIAISLPGEAKPTLTSDGYAIGASNDAGLSVAVVPAGEAGGTRFLTVADQSYSGKAIHEYTYNFALPADVELRVLSSGDLVLVDTTSEPVISLNIDEFLESNPEIDRPNYLLDVAAAAPGRGPDSDLALDSTDAIVGVFEQPWSVDANGNELQTSYAVDGDKLIQIVDTTGAAFPVVSDPAPLLVLGLLVAARAFVPLTMRAFSVVPLSSSATGITSGIRTFSSFNKLKAFTGAAKTGHQWHHIVPQTQKFMPIPVTSINSTRNVIQIPTKIHQACVTATMNSKRLAVGNYPFDKAIRVSDQVTQWSWERQYRFGIALLRICGVNV